MSYILEALTRSQKQRERSTIPTLTTAYLTGETKRTTDSLWQITTIGLASIAIVVGVYSVSTRYLGSRTEAAVPPASNSDATRTVAVTERTSPLAPSEPASDGAPPTPQLNEDSLARGANAPAGARPQAANDPEKAAHARSTAEAPSHVTKALAHGLEKGSEKQLSPQARWLAEEILALRRDAERETSREGTVPAGLEDVREPTPSRVSDSKMTGKSGHSANRGQMEVETAPASDLPLLADLPPAKRTAIPPLEMNVHAYARSHDERKVLINMRVYREGDRLREGPVVDAITPTGVELTFDNQRFRLMAR